jgi:hypothetical protein
MYKTCDSQTAAIEARHWPLARSEVQPAHCAGAYATAAAVHARHDRRRRAVGRVVIVIAGIAVVFVVVSRSPAAWFFNIAAVWAARAVNGRPAPRFRVGPRGTAYLNDDWRRSQAHFVRSTSNRAVAFSGERKVFL